jgi:hypothetical protein
VIILLLTDNSAQQWRSTPTREHIHRTDVHDTRHSHKCDCTAEHAFSYQLSISPSMRQISEASESFCGRRDVTLGKSWSGWCESNFHQSSKTCLNHSAFLETALHPRDLVVLGNSSDSFIISEKMQSTAQMSADGPIVVPFLNSSSQRVDSVPA